MILSGGVIESFKCNWSTQCKDLGGSGEGRGSPGFFDNVKIVKRVIYVEHDYQTLKLFQDIFFYSEY
jgi:hypothetical protein